MNRILFGAIATGLAAATANASILIDSFETTQTCLANSASPNVSNTVNGAGIIGSEREMFADWIMGANDVQEIANSSNDGYLNFNLGADTAGMGKIVWDGPDNNTGVFDPTGLGGVDLTDGGVDSQLTVRIVFDDLPISLRFRVYSDAANYSEYYLMAPGGIFGAIDVPIPYASFNVAGGAGADFTNVGAIELGLFPDMAATDVQIDFIQTDVPSPAPLALAGLAGLAGAKRRRR